MKLPFPELHHLLCHTPPFASSLSFVFHPFCPCSSFPQYVHPFFLFSFILSHVPFHFHVLFHWPLYPTHLYSAPTSSSISFLLPMFHCPSQSTSLLLHFHILPYPSLSSAPVAHCSPSLPAMLLHHSSRFISTVPPSPTTSCSSFLPSSFISLLSHHLPHPLAPSSPTTSCPFLCSIIMYFPFLLPSLVTSPLHLIPSCHHSPCPIHPCASPSL